MPNKKITVLLLSIISFAPHCSFAVANYTKIEKKDDKFQHKLFDNISHPLNWHLFLKNNDQLSSPEDSYVAKIKFFSDNLNHSDALKATHSAIAEYPQQIIFRLLKIQILTELYQYAQATKETQYLRNDLNINSLFLHNLSVTLLIRQGKIARALEEIKQAQNLLPGWGQELKAWAYLLKAEPYMAKLEIESYIPLHSKNNLFTLSLWYEACKQIGDLVCADKANQQFSENTEKTAEATDSYTESFSNQKLQPLDYLAQIRALILEDKANDAIEVANELIALFPESPLGYQAKVQLAISKEYFDIAHQTVSKMIHKLPENPASYQLKAQLYLLQGKNNLALQNYQKLMLALPEYISPVQEYGEVLMQSGEFNLAISFYTRQLKQFPNAYWLWLRLAKAYRNQSLYKQAEKNYQTAISQFPKRVIAYNGLGATQLSQRKLLEAASIYQKSLSIKTKNFEALSGLANIYLMQNQFKKAEDYARKSVKSFPENPLPYSTLAETLFHQGKEKEAEQACIQLNSKIIKPFDYYTLGECYEVIGKFDEALSIAKKIYRTQKTPLALDHLAKAYYKNKNWQKAVELYQKVVNDSSTSISTIENYARSMAELGRYQDALDLFNKILESHPRNANIHISIGGQLFNLGQYQEAIKSYLKSLEFGSSEKLLFKFIAQSYLKLKQFDQSDIWFDKYLASDPTSREIIATYAEYIYQRKKYVKAIEFCDDNLVDFPKDEALLRIIFFSYTATKQIQPALQNFNILLRNQQIKARDYHTMGLAYARQNQLDQALSYFIKAVELSPETFQYYNELGYTYFSKKQLAKALATYQKGLSLPDADNNGLLNYNYALALYSTGQFKAANQALNRAIKTGYSGSPRFKQLLESKIKPVAK